MPKPLITLLSLYSVIHYHAYFIAGITKTELCVIFVVCLYNYTLKPQLDFFLLHIHEKRTCNLIKGSLCSRLHSNSIMKQN